jgi:hypothetical protein
VPHPFIQLPTRCRWLTEGLTLTTNERYDMYDKEAQRKEAEEISDLEAQWYRGFPKVVDVVNVITEDDIVCGCGCQGTEVHDECACGEQSCFWCADTLVGTDLTDDCIPF